MPTVIIATDGSGKQRRCDAKCHDARGEKCNCVCEGRNHGLGLQHALDKTHAWVIEMLEMDYPGWTFRRPQHQLELLERK